MTLFRIRGPSGTVFGLVYRPGKVGLGDRTSPASRNRSRRPISPVSYTPTKDGKFSWASQSLVSSVCGLVCLRPVVPLSICLEVQGFDPCLFQDSTGYEGETRFTETWTFTTKLQQNIEIRHYNIYMLRRVDLTFGKPLFPTKVKNLPQEDRWKEVDETYIIRELFTSKRLFMTKKVLNRHHYLYVGFHGLLSASRDGEDGVGS